MKNSFDELVAKVSECEMKKVAVAVAQDSEVLEAVREAKNITEPVAVMVRELGLNGADSLALAALSIGGGLGGQKRQQQANAGQCQDCRPYISNFSIHGCTSCVCFALFSDGIGKICPWRNSFFQKRA